MHLVTSLLFELPVYRIDKLSYYDAFRAFRKKQLISHIPEESSYYLDSFGGQWEYNEIIGFLKFYVSGSTQIRVEYHETSSRRKVKTRKKVFKPKRGSFCTRQIGRNMTNTDLILVFEQCIDHCRQNLNRKRYIDLTFFEATYRHTDWKSIIA